MYDTLIALVAFIGGIGIGAVLAAFFILNFYIGKIMSTLADLVTQDTQLKTEVGQVVTFIQQEQALIVQLQQQIAAASGSLPPDQQAQLDQTVADLVTVNSTLAGALPAAPAPSSN